MLPVLDAQDRDISMVQYNAETHQLIVHQTDENHQRLAWYLDDIKGNAE
ncbi:MAG: hypothetical protein VCD00_04180 [Candidatus Hydrogenedentota bacterium]